jgi:hypothetical protein
MCQIVEGRKPVNRADFCGPTVEYCPHRSCLPDHDDGRVHPIMFSERHCAWAWHLADRRRSSILDSEKNKESAFRYDIR